GAITKRMTAIEEMAGMDVLCCDKTGTLTLNHLTVDKNLIEVFSGGMDRDMIILLAARASRVDNQDAIDMAIINMLSDPKEARANITEVHFLPFNPVDKRTAITYIDSGGNWSRVSKGAPEQILNLCFNKDDIAEKAQRVVDSFAERGLRSLAVAYQEVPERSRHGDGGPWVFCGVLPLFDPPRHDSAGHHPQGPGPGRVREDDHRRPPGDRQGDRPAARDGDQHAPVGGAVRQPRRRRRGGGDAGGGAGGGRGRVRGRVPGAQARDRAAPAGQRPRVRDDGRRRERRAGAEEGGHRHRGVGRDGRRPGRRRHRADGARPRRHRLRRPHQPRHLPAHEELHDLRRVHHHTDSGWVCASGVDMGVRLPAVHGARHSHTQRWDDHGDIQGPGDAVVEPGQLEAEGDIRHRRRHRRLPRAGHGALLLGGHQNHILRVSLRGAVAEAGRGGGVVGGVPAGEHHQPGPDIRDPQPGPLLPRPAGGAARRRLRRRAAGGHPGGGVRGRRLRVDQRRRVALGRRHLALQPGVLPPARPHQGRRPLRPQRRGLGPAPRPEGGGKTTTATARRIAL
ncbi:hypothetical protein CFC21_050833, partial [Triticum aestivum]